MRHPLTLFFLLTIAMTWGFSALALSAPRAWTPLLALLSLPATFGPSLVAFGLTAYRNGISEVKILLGRFLIWRVEWHWYLFALFYMSVVMLIVMVSDASLDAWPSQPPWGMILSSAIFRLPVRASEEIGWRGFALPRLSKRFGPRIASLILGPLWALWHLPAFIVPTTSSDRQSFPAFILMVTALSVIFAWLYSQTKGSLLLVTLFHSAANETISVFPPTPEVPSVLALPTDSMTWLFLILLWFTAAYCWRRW